ncbi:MAG: DUF4153 domain-containing protein, partial [Flavobacteriales bacterium]|nr:DUF4153 domain-containing protein [Flavobacteriales bacterium]
MKKWINPSYLLSVALKSFNRFPTTVLYALVGSAYASSGLFNEFIMDEIHFINILLTIALGLPSSFTLHIASETYGWNKLKSALSWILLAGFLVFIWSTLPSSEDASGFAIAYYRYAILSAAFHLAAAVVPFVRSKDLTDFWFYNHQLFTGFITAALYSLILYGGIALAHVAVDQLFDLHLDEKFYGYLFFWVAGLLNTLFFLSGLSKEIEGIGRGWTLAKSFRFLVRYLLIPLLIVYIVILYSYGAKILFTNDWPEGLIGWMIIAVSVVGVLTTLLAYPFGQDEKEKWVRLFQKGYYIAIIPLLILLFYAIGIRVHMYGLTINRCLLLLMGVWLLGISIYFNLGKKNIKVVPTSLAIIFLVMSIGPWSIFKMSERSQVNRVEELLSNLGQLNESGQLLNEIEFIPSDKYTFENLTKEYSKLPVDENISYDNDEELRDLVDYLVGQHGFGTLNKFFSQDLSAIAKENDLRWRGYNLHKMMGVKGQDRPDSYSRKWLHLQLLTQTINDVRDYDYIFDIRRVSAGPNERGVEYTEMMDGHSVRYYYHEDEHFVSYKDQTVRFELDSVIQSIAKESLSQGLINFDKERMTVKGIPDVEGQWFQA